MEKVGKENHDSRIMSVKKIWEGRERKSRERLSWKEDEDENTVWWWFHPKTLLTHFIVSLCFLPLFQQDIPLLLSSEESKEDHKERKRRERKRYNAGAQFLMDRRSTESLNSLLEIVHCYHHHFSPLTPVFLNDHISNKSHIKNRRRGSMCEKTKRVSLKGKNF